MLYGLTGLIFAFTGFPRLVRAVIAPLPLLAQLADIGCWWLTRLDPRFADGIIIAGGVVAAGLMLHIVLGLFSMYGKVGRVALLILVLRRHPGAWQAKERYIDPYLAAEKTALQRPARSNALRSGERERPGLSRTTPVAHAPRSPDRYLHFSEHRG